MRFEIILNPETTLALENTMRLSKRKDLSKAEYIQDLIKTHIVSLMPVTLPDVATGDATRKLYYCDVDVRKTSINQHNAPTLNRLLNDSQEFKHKNKLEYGVKAERLLEQIDSKNNTVLTLIEELTRIIQDEVIYK